MSGTGGIVSHAGDSGSAGLKLGLALGERDNEPLVIDGVLESK